MDLSNLGTSLREDESSTLRRTRHLRSSEDQLSAVFRSAATSLTTLYRQGVASSKASYEKGYTHALAHVLELCDKDRDWLKGYLQRRIEALEVEGEDEVVEEQTTLSTSANLGAAIGPRVASETETQSPSQRQSNKRSRSGYAGSPQHQQQRGGTQEDDTARRQMHRMPHQLSLSSSSSSSNNRNSAAPSLFPSTSSFNFSTPLAYPTLAKPAPIHDPTVNIRQTSSTKSSSSHIGGGGVGGVIKTSNAATSRRRLQRLKGLRAGRDRIIEVDPHTQRDEMVHENETIAGDEADAWTDEEGAADENNDDGRKIRGGGGGEKKNVVWAEKGTSAGEGMHHIEDDRVLERFDRRKRRKSSRQFFGSAEGMVDMDELAEIGTTSAGARAGGQGEADGVVGYHS